MCHSTVILYKNVGGTYGIWFRGVVNMLVEGSEIQQGATNAALTVKKLIKCQS